MTPEVASSNGHRSVHSGERVPILYLAPWVDFGGSDKGTIDWFRWLDRDRFAPSLITTQPSPNRRLAEVAPFAEEIWALPECMAGRHFPGFIFDFLHTRGVRLVHIMNSRLAYELLPDLVCLDEPPLVVVQLHVEEPDRSGFVRYVATRYGNLVDGFSVSSRHLAAALEGYDIPRAKIHVIPTGVDAEGEFSPERVKRREREDGVFRILFAGRLAEQKDPLLMLAVVKRLVPRHENVQVEVVGDGPLTQEVEQRVHELDLANHVHLHPATPDLATWLADSDLLLMTSRFEGIPYMAFEAMAMRVPVVAPALPGNVELVGPGGGCLIESRDRPGHGQAPRDAVQEAAGGAQGAIGAEPIARPDPATRAHSGAHPASCAAFHVAACHVRAASVDRHPLLQPRPLPAQLHGSGRGAGLPGARSDRRRRRLRRSRHARAVGAAR